jgi:8-oxo-dGTP pyrophosphatase MutT (NUDIX family)
MTRGLVGAADPALQPSTSLADVVQLLGAYRADAAPAQRDAADRMLAFAHEHPDALLRSCLEGHFTGSALVVDAAGERALFLFHRKLQRWLQPGGHADGSGNLVATAWREATEETGIDGLTIDPLPIDLDIHVIEAGSDPRHLHIDVRFLVVAPADAVEQGNHESEALRWVTPDEAPELGLDAGTLRLLTAGFARLRAIAPT